jgi:hypothetical protein
VAVGRRAAAVTIAAAVLLGLWRPNALRASSPQFFQAVTQLDFLQGDLDNLSIDGRGQLQLGPATELVYETAAPFLWTLLPGADGTLFVGTGNEGRVFRVDAQGRGSAFFDAAELEVHALAAAPNGGLYVASSPDGKIYRVDRNGSSSVFFDPEDKYIWALATDARGNVFAGTGDKGVVYKISPDGRGEPFYTTKATHATALAVDKAGNLLVGTESPGQLLRVDPEGKAFLLLDTPFDEVHSLRFDDKGVLYVAAMSGRPGSGGAPPAPSEPASGSSSGNAARPGIPTVTVEVSAATIADSSGSSGSSTSSEDRRAARGAVYRVLADGVWDQLWESREDLPYDVVPDSEGHLLIATGAKGKLYRLEGDPQKPTLVARAGAQQVTALHRDSRGAIYFATANPGKIFRLSSGLAPQGTYISPVQDAKMPASWGVITWRGAANGGRIEISTRTGNSATPDEAWSPWSAPYAASGAAIVSPKARYLQWRVVLSGRGQSPVLTSINAAYLQRNVRPQVRSITVHPPGIVFQKPFPSGDPDLAGFDNQTTPERKLAAEASTSSSSSSSLGRRAYEKGLQTFAWRADDENDDELSYDLEYRREGDAVWKPLRQGITDTIYVWDTTTVPDGTYFVRVKASDLPSNAPDAALTGELDSNAFEVDNLAPSFSTPVVRAANGRTIVIVDVTDDHSPIQRVEYSRDGYEWTAVFPADGIADSRTEHYEVTVEGTLGPRGLTLRAIDALNNTSTTQVDGSR